MENIVLIKFGSYLYGTTTPESDRDIKGIYLPKARDILLQQVTPVISQKREKAHGEKNMATDTDYECYSPEKYLLLLAEGQMVALDMLYAPESALLITSPTWTAIKQFAPNILTKQAVSLVRYCKVQANKYGMKGSRILAAQLLLETLTKAESQFGASAKLQKIADDVQQLVSCNKGISIGSQPTIHGTEIKYVDIGGKKALFNSSLKTARNMVQKLLNEYGHRAQAAALNEGVDWKALSHAVRIGRQALEFFTFHRITFPRPEASYLIEIKQGNVSYQQVTDEIEQLLTQVEHAARQASLPETFDQKLIDDFIECLYLEQVKREYR